VGHPALAADYNTRLFAPGLYGSHHRARFRWLRGKLAALGLPRARVLEIGCFDGKTVDWLPCEIERYVGLDAGWESGERNGQAVGLAAAQQRFGDDARFACRRSSDPEDVWQLDGEFDVGVCMETLEHIEPADVESYLAALARKVRGPLLVTVPNEKGAALLVKTLAAKALGIDRDISYSKREFINALLGRTGRVPRHHHKGFDYAVLARRLTHHFGEVTIEGVDTRRLPYWLQSTIGIVAGGRSRGVRSLVPRRPAGINPPSANLSFRGEEPSAS
jgi:Methyltransferase domain